MIVSIVAAMGRNSGCRIGFGTFLRGIQKSRETGLWQLITGYLRAKKEQICPLIIFEDQDD